MPGLRALPQFSTALNPRIMTKIMESLWNHCGITPESLVPTRLPGGCLAALSVESYLNYLSRQGFQVGATMSFFFFSSALPSYRGLALAGLGCPIGILGETSPCLIQRGPGFLLGFNFGHFYISHESAQATKGTRGGARKAEPSW